MKRYLNSTEKNQAHAIGGLQAFMDDRIEEWEKLGRPKELLKAARMTKAWAHNTLKEFIKGLDADEVSLLVKNSKKLKVVVRTKDQALRELKEMQRLDSVVTIDREKFEDVCSFAIMECMKCTKTDFKNCALRSAMMENDIEPLNAYSNQCQYQYTEIKENAVFDVVELEATGQLFRVQPGIRIKGFKVVNEAPLPECYWHLPKIIQE